jgi:capsular polysaccharide export protein
VQYFPGQASYRVETEIPFGAAVPAISRSRQIPQGGRRSFLFLQGNVSWFFSRLGAALRARGHDVHRINFNGGDRLFWRLPGAIDYRGDLSGLPGFLEALIRERRVTDILLFGDCRPVHRDAITLAKLYNIGVHVFEEGYLRPDWITMERGGVNGYTTLPRRPEAFLAASRWLPRQPFSPEETVRNSFVRRAGEDILYHCARLIATPFYRRYKFHAPVDPFLEYAGWVRRFLKAPAEKRRSAATLARLAEDIRFYLVPLQLDSDYQVRVHSRYQAGLAPALDEIMRSFAAHAPVDSLLVIKSHPLDNGLCDWRAVIARLAAEHRLDDRVLFIDHPNLAWLIHRSSGVVTINSTVGGVALQMRRPLIALADAIYNIEGLCFQQGLDRFWTEGKPADPALYGAFIRVLKHRCLVRGGFYSRSGVAEAVAGAVERLEQIRIDLPPCAEIVDHPRRSAARA